MALAGQVETGKSECNLLASKMQTVAIQRLETSNFYTRAKSLTLGKVLIRERLLSNKSRYCPAERLRDCDLLDAWLPVGFPCRIQKMGSKR